MKERIILLILLLFAIGTNAQEILTVQCSPGTLNSKITQAQKQTISTLIVSGTIDARDFKCMREELPMISTIDLAEVKIAGYKGSMGTGGSDIDSYEENTIPDNAFRMLLTLTEVILPDSLKAIGPSSFINCPILKKINLPTTLTSIGTQAFSFCDSLKSLVIPPLVLEIGEATFSMSRYLERVVLPSGLKSIGYGAFSSCYRLKDLSIPESVTTIGKMAFRRCRNLSTNIPSSVMLIEEGAFDSCDSIKVAESNAYYSSHDGILYDKEMTRIMHCPITQRKSFQFPSSVTKIDPYTFSNCSQLDSVVFHDNLKVINERAFFDCIGLTSLSIPSSIKVIEDYAFEGCWKLDSVKIPSSVLHVGVGAFSNCFRLSSINLPDSLISISARLFSNCPNLKDIKIPKSVGTIGNSAFSGCNKLDSITIPNNVDSIKCNSFIDCYRLRSISIPSSTVFIGSFAFSNCMGLKKIYAFPTKVISLNTVTDIFDGVNKDSCILFVPFGMAGKYKNAYQWKDFRNIEELEGAYTSKETIEFNCNEDSVKINLFSNTAWTIKTDEPWVKVNLTKGFGNATLTFLVSVNDSLDIRSAKSTISGENFRDQTIRINQKGMNTEVLPGQKNIPSIYPNPASDFLYIQDGCNHTRINIFNESSKLVFNSTGKERLNISQLKPGFYNIIIYRKSERFSYKLIKN